MQLARLARRHSDWVLAVGLAVLWQAEVWTIVPAHPAGAVGGEAYSTAERAIAAVVGLVSALALAWRRRAPLAVLSVAIVVAASALVVRVIDAASVPALVLVITAYSAGAHTAGRRALLGGLGVAVLIAAGVGEPSAGNLLFVGMILGGAWLAGRFIRHGRERERALEQLTLELEREREERARAAVAQERIRIARELHDVVAHAIGVIVLQARGGRRSLVSDPEEVREALNTIEATGTQALAEMRLLVGMLRANDEDSGLAPQPGLRQLEALAAQVREAGLPVEVAVEGPPVELPPGVDMSAYRIVQEGLTNVLKHAGPTTARVVVRYRGGDVEVEIADAGVGAAAGDGGGHGLLGIRERVAVYGGEMEAGPRPEGGFRLRARLPVDAG